MLDLRAPSERTFVRRLDVRAAGLTGAGLACQLVLGWPLVAGLFVGAGLTTSYTSRWVVGRLLDDLHANGLTISSYGRVVRPWRLYADERIARGRARRRARAVRGHTR